MEKDNRAVEVFDEFAEVYAEKYGDVSKYANGLRVFLEGIPTEGVVLELACGPGNVTAHLLSKRPDLNLLATDLSPKMLTLAKNIAPHANFKRLDCRALADVKAMFDAVIMAFGLPYMNRGEVERFADDLALKVKGSGVVYLSWIEDDFSQSGEQTNAAGTHTLNQFFYRKDELLAIFKSLSFEEVYFETLPIDNSGGTFPRDAVIIFKKQSV